MAKTKIEKEVELTETLRDTPLTDAHKVLDKALDDLTCVAHSLVGLRMSLDEQLEEKQLDFDDF